MFPTRNTGLGEVGLSGTTYSHSFLGDAQEILLTHSGISPAGSQGNVWDARDLSVIHWQGKCPIHWTSLALGSPVLLFFM